MNNTESVSSVSKFNRPDDAGLLDDMFSQLCALLNSKVSTVKQKYHS